ncbi:hypothetical protein RGU12_17810 [Fredinandcohnia sp. QZ13]|uniref:hypothetical protein n=1 Tax=Fredinandcohnia sp. QZ13 TaxID=3073144 RepID=UPI00285317E9|nr:hypothetical protein [Fredinandcohnia sp. QZ13]MDR4889350.1 hypothetical protein [Fredinandcohnia sp. QZ13]
MKNTYPNKSFPKFQLNNAQRTHIVNQIRTSKTKKENRFSSSRFIMPFLSGVVILLLVFGIGTYSYYSIFKEELLHADSVSSFIIDLPKEFTIEEQGDSHIFLKNGTEVGGVKKINKKLKQQLLSQSGIFEDDLLEDFQEPTQRVLFHVKEMHAIQTVHYFIQPNDQEVIYDLYFHANNPGYFGGSDYQADLKIIHEIAKTFRLN